jgi:hypothetical protein
VSMLDKTPPTHEEIFAMTPHQHRSYATVVRRAAEQQGLTLRRSKVRDPNHQHYRTCSLHEERSAYRGNWTVRAQVMVYGIGEIYLNDIHRLLLDPVVVEAMRLEAWARLADITHDARLGRPHEHRRYV